MHFQYQEAQYQEAFLAIAARDVEALVGFYCQLFDEEPHVRIPGTYASFRRPGLRLDLFRPAADRAFEFSGERSAIALCLQVPDLDAAIARLQVFGAIVGAAIEASHGREAYAYDPEGNRTIIYQPYELER